MRCFIGSINIINVGYISANASSTWSPAVVIQKATPFSVNSQSDLRDSQALK